MSDPVANAARAAAGQLAADFGPALVIDVEAALGARSGLGSPDRYFDPIALGSLIVSVATLAWTIYEASRKKNAKPAVEVVARRVRMQIEAHESVTASQRDRVIDIVVNEIVAAAPDSESE